MKRLILTAALILSVAAPAVRVEAATPTLVCCTAAEITTVKDLAYLTRKLGVPDAIAPRLDALMTALKTGQPWQDPDRGLVLGYVAAIPDVTTWAPNKTVLEDFARSLGVTIKPVGVPVVVTPVPDPVPAPTGSAGLTEAQVLVLINRELAKLPTASPGTTTTSPSFPSLRDTGDGYLTFTAKDNGGARQSVRGDFQGRFGINGYDAGMRILQNWNENGSPCFTSQLPAATVGMDSQGAFSYNGQPCNGSWSGSQLYGQAFVIDGGWSQAGYDYASGAQLKPSILLASQRAAMDILFAVTPWRKVGDPVLNKVVMRLRSDGSADPVDVVIGGQLRTLKACGNTVCF